MVSFANKHNKFGTNAYHIHIFEDVPMADIHMLSIQRVSYIVDLLGGYVHVIFSLTSILTQADGSPA
jgi:hypothetical protein